MGPRDHEYSQSGLCLRARATGFWWSSRRRGGGILGRSWSIFVRCKLLPTGPFSGQVGRARLGKRGNNPASKRLGGCHSEDGPKHGTPFSAGQTLPRATDGSPRPRQCRLCLGPAVAREVGPAKLYRLGPHGTTTEVRLRCTDRFAALVFRQFLCMGTLFPSSGPRKTIPCTFSAKLSPSLWVQPEGDRGAAKRRRFPSLAAA